MNSGTITRNRRLSLCSAVLFVAVLLLAMGVSCTGQSSEQPTAIATEPQGVPTTPVPTVTEEAPLPTATVEAPAPTAVSEASIPDGWVTYTNQQCEYAISYPPEMEVGGEGTSGQSLAFKLDSPGRGPTNFIYVSMIDQESQTAGEEIIYNYDPAETEILLNMQVGDSEALRDIADVAPYFTYERKPDTTIGGYDAQAYENTQPWEFPEGTKEIRYYLTLNGCTYLIGGYLDTTGLNETGAIDEELFSQIVTTIQLP